MKKWVKIKFEGDLTPARLKAMRVLLKQSISHVAKKTAFSENYISQIESGKIIPPQEHVVSLLQALDVEARTYAISRHPLESETL